MTTDYEAPAVRDLGSLTELTAQTFNKVGTTPDTFTQITNGAVIGSLVSSP
ncbi:MAG: lasso RiPP family leader peptide-containing protein [Thermoleophilaceae bacterium]